jgi:hypothetical protein
MELLTKGLNKILLYQLKNRVYPETTQQCCNVEQDTEIMEAWPSSSGVT